MSVQFLQSCLFERLFFIIEFGVQCLFNVQKFSFPTDFMLSYIYFILEEWITFKIAAKIKIQLLKRILLYNIKPCQRHQHLFGECEFFQTSKIMKNSENVLNIMLSSGTDLLWISKFQEISNKPISSFNPNKRG